MVVLVGSFAAEAAGNYTAGEVESADIRCHTVVLAEVHRSRCMAAGAMVLDMV